jgi:hypothetical protein
LEGSLACLKNSYFEDVSSALKANAKYNILTKPRALDAFRKAGLIQGNRKKGGSNKGGSQSSRGNAAGDEVEEVLSKFLITFEKAAQG